MINLYTLFVLIKAFIKPSKVVCIALALKTTPKSNIINI
jgi:hypothetical protein